LGLITRSANDAAVVAAEGLAGSVDRFAQTMTRKARELGMSRTNFENASGLPNEDQVTTARDMARLARALIYDFPNFYPLFATSEFIFNGRVNANHNRLMDHYPGMDGLKTGYVRASGFNLVASAVRNGRRLIAVVIGGRSPGHRDQEVARLLDAAFARVGPLQPGTQPRVAEPPPARQIEPPVAQAPPPVALKPPAVTLKPPAAAPAPQRPAANDDWSVQVGTFNRPEVAKYAAQQALKVAAKALDGGDPEVATIVQGKNKSYRAIVTGLTQTQAREACKILATRKDFGCLVLPPAKGERLATPGHGTAARNRG
jgi:D-alanyl-D-alanine carboxypeptidase